MSLRVSGLPVSVRQGHRRARVSALLCSLCYLVRNCNAMRPFRPCRTPALPSDWSEVEVNSEIPTRSSSHEPLVTWETGESKKSDQWWLPDGSCICVTCDRCFTYHINHLEATNHKVSYPAMRRRLSHYCCRWHRPPAWRPWPPDEEISVQGDTSRCRFESAMNRLIAASACPL